LRTDFSRGGAEGQAAGLGEANALMLAPLECSEGTNPR
jgi:hypothetical protein